MSVFTKPEPQFSKEELWSIVEGMSEMMNLANRNIYHADKQPEGEAKREEMAGLYEMYGEYHRLYTKSLALAEKA